jgi:hypothetical protein
LQTADAEDHCNACCAILFKVPAVAYNIGHAVSIVLGKLWQCCYWQQLQSPGTITAAAAAANTPLLAFPSTEREAAQPHTLRC